MENKENKNAKIKKSHVNLKIFNKLLFALFIVMGIYYIALANDLSVKGFALSDLKQQRNKLAEANNKLELEAMALSSYANINQRISGLKMVAVGNIDYINGGSDLVAKK